jgi:hypothetical protein
VQPYDGACASVTPFTTVIADSVYPDTSANSIRFVDVVSASLSRPPIARYSNKNVLVLVDFFLIYIFFFFSVRQDGDKGEIGGVLSIEMPPNEAETGVTNYRLYWAQGDEKLLGYQPIRTFHRSEQVSRVLYYTFAMNTLIPEGATHFAVFTSGGTSCEMNR